MQEKTLTPPPPCHLKTAAEKLANTMARKAEMDCELEEAQCEADREGVERGR